MNLKNLIRSVIIAGLFIVPFVPLVISSSLFFPFITGKAFTFRIVVGIVFVLWLALILLNREHRPKRSWILFSLLAFLAVLTLATVFGVNPYRSFWSNFERMEGLITLLHLGAFFLVASSVFNEKWWWRFFHLSLAVSVIVSFYGILQLTGSVNISQGDVRLDGTMGNAIYLAVYMLFHIFIALYYFFQRSDVYKYAYLALMALQAFVLYNTATRGVILALIGGLLVTFLLILLFERERRVLRKSAGISLLAVLLIVGGFLALKDSNFVKQSSVLSRFTELSFEQVKGQGRYFVWPMAVEGFKEKPILGYGPENFVYVFSKHYNPAMYSHEPWFDRVHNVYLDWLIAGGILGLITFLLIIFFTFFALWRSSKISVVGKSVFSGLLAGYLFQGLFDFDNLTSYILFFSVIAYISYLESSDRPAIFSFRELSESAVKKIVIPALIIVFIIFGYFVHYKPLLASRTLILALHPQTPAEESLKYFRQVFDYSAFGNQESIIHLFNRTAQVIGSNAPESLKQSFFELAEERISIQTERFPNDVFVLISAGGFYNRLGQGEKALEILERAKELSPGKQDVYFEIGQALFSLGRKQEVLETFEFAYGLEPKNPNARISYALGLMLLGNQEQAEEILESIPESYIYFDDRLLNAFAETKQFQKVLEIWQVRVQANPQNIQFRQSLVASYLSLRMWDKAIEEIENIVEIEPGFRETADYAITEIRAGRGSALIGN